MYIGIYIYACVYIRVCIYTHTHIQLVRIVLFSLLPVVRVWMELPLGQQAVT